MIFVHHFFFPLNFLFFGLFLVHFIYFFNSKITLFTAITHTQVIHNIKQKEMEKNVFQLKLVNEQAIKPEDQWKYDPNQSTPKWRPLPINPKNGKNLYSLN